MKTSTIYRALDCVREASAFFATEKRVRQAGTFERELLRRMDERDEMVAERNARATVIHAPRALGPSDWWQFNDSRKSVPDWRW